MGALGYTQQLPITLKYVVDQIHDDIYVQPLGPYLTSSSQVTRTAENATASVASLVADLVVSGSVAAAHGRDRRAATNVGRVDVGRNSQEHGEEGSGELHIYYLFDGLWDRFEELVDWRLVFAC